MGIHADIQQIKPLYETTHETTALGTQTQVWVIEYVSRGYLYVGHNNQQRTE
jgi:hypothetical protein